MGKAVELVNELWRQIDYIAEAPFPAEDIEKELHNLELEIEGLLEGVKIAKRDLHD